MKFQSHIPKPPLLSRLKLLSVGLFTALTCLLINPITAHADLTAGAANAIADSVVASYNGTHSDNHGGDSAIPNGVAYTRTGYLCYLLTKDGSPTGDPAYAFYSPGYNEIAGSQWVCTSRRGHTVSSWKGDAKWGVTPWGNRGVPSYEPDIRDWMLQPIDGAPQAYAFVKDCWGAEAAKNFLSDDYILVLETIMNFQYSVKGGNGGSSGDSGLDLATKANIYSSCYRETKSYVKGLPDIPFSEMMKGTGAKDSDELIYILANQAYERALAKLQAGNAGSNRTFTSDPLIGTVPNLITYKKGNTVFDSYTNKVAPHSEKIKVNEAGFTAYTGTGALSDSEVQSYGVAMLIIHCKSDAIHTYWEPHGSPGNPEPRIPNKTGTCNIVKGYYKENLTTGAKQSLGVYYELDVTSNIIVSGEPTFELVEWRVTTATSTGVNPIAWNPPGTTSQQGKAGATLSLKDPEDCVYVLLRQVEEEETPTQDYNYLIPQSSITRRIWFSAPDNQLSMPKIQDHEFTWAIPAHNPAECPGHNYTVEETKKDADGNAEKNEDGSEKKETVTKTDYCTGWKWWDNGGAHQLHLSIHNDNWNDYHDILATKTTQFRSDAGDEVEKQKFTKRWYNNQVFSRADPASSAQQYKETNWDYICVIMRGKDKLTLAEWVNAGESKAPSTQANDDLANASSSGFSVGNTPAGTRKTQMYFETFSANFVNESEGRGADNKTQWGPETAAPHSGGKCPKTWTEIVLSPLAISSIVVKIDTYSGDPAGGVADAECNHADMNLGWFGGLGSTSSMSINSGRMVESGGAISFYPYIQMKYDVKTAKAKQAFVLGQYSRGIIPNDYAEISWNPTGSNPNLTLISPQWSLHATAKKDFGADQVLPGGATLGLGIKKQDRQTVVVTTYQCIVEDKGKVQVDKTGGSDGSLDEAQAVSAHEAYVASVVSALENTHVEQYVDKNGEASDAFGGIIVYPGSSINALNNEQAEGKASTDDKYYFRNNNTTASGSNEGDYDVQNKGTVSKKYTFRSDTEGQILMNDGVILSKTADAGAVGGEAKQLDDRTYVVRKLVKAIERNTGVDNGAPNSFDPVEVPNWAPDGAWYNEAFDGITVIVQRTELIVGFIDPPERSQVLDPRLIPWTQNKGDMLNSSGSKRDDYNTCQFKTRKYSEDYGSGHPEVMGTFKDVDVKMRNLEKLFWSRPFRIPNMTTQDLR